MSLIPAYLGEFDDHHLICSQCPDSQDTQDTVRSMEEKRNIDHILRFAEYEKKQILLTICSACINNIESHA